VDNLKWNKGERKEERARFCVDLREGRAKQPKEKGLKL